MILRFISTLQILLLISVFSYSQSVSFLNSPSDARNLGMGNSGYVLPSSFAVQYNAASIMTEHNPKFGAGASLLMWQPQFMDATLINVGGYSKFNKFGIMAGFRSNSLKEVVKTDEQGNVKGAFVPSEYAFELGLGYSVTSNIALGVAFRQISSKIDEEAKSSAFATDVSVLYYKDQLRLGLGLSNLGSKIDYGAGQYQLPTRIKAGMAYNFDLNEVHSVVTAADVFYQMVPNYSGIASGLGAEYSYKKMLAFRTGYHFESQSVGSSYATVGLGGNYSGFSLDLAYVLASGSNPMGNTMLFSLKWAM